MKDPDQAAAVRLIISETSEEEKDAMERRSSSQRGTSVRQSHQLANAHGGWRRVQSPMWRQVVGIMQCSCNSQTSRRRTRRRES